MPAELVCPYAIFVSQILTVLSHDPETTRLPSGENATDVTQCVCPSNGPPSIFCVSTSQILIVLSSEPEARRFPSGENVAW